MEKQIRRFDINHNIDWDGAKIEDIREDLDALESKGATHIEFQVSEYSCDVEAYANRLETDAEYEERIKSAAESDERFKWMEIEKYQKIKAKYNLQ